MKIRILGNSIRLRLSQPEVADFLEKGKVEVKSHFGILSSEVLTYSLEKVEVKEPTAVFHDGHIKVMVPISMGNTWASSDHEVGMEHQQALDENQTLRILVEKDFQCLTTRAGEDESDNFPNPNQNC